MLFYMLVSLFIHTTTTAGTIFAVYEKADGSIGTIEDVMRAGVDIKVRTVLHRTIFVEHSSQNALCRTVLLLHRSYLRVVCKQNCTEYLQLWQCYMLLVDQ
jgi:hypothetical protein